MLSWSRIALLVAACKKRSLSHFFHCYESVILILHLSLPSAVADVADKRLIGVQAWMVSTLCNALLFMTNVWTAFIMSFASLVSLLCYLKMGPLSSEIETNQILMHGSLGLLWCGTTLSLLSFTAHWLVSLALQQKPLPGAANSEQGLPRE